MNIYAFYNVCYEKTEIAGSVIESRIVKFVGIIIADNQVQAKHMAQEYGMIFSYFNRLTSNENKNIFISY